MCRLRDAGPEKRLVRQQAFGLLVSMAQAFAQRSRLAIMRLWR